MSTDSLSELWETYRREPTAELRDLLARHYVGLVHHTARQISRQSPSLEADELVGAGSLGLLRALERFDVTRGLAFSTYAVQCIRGAIQDDLRKRDWMPRGARARARRIAAARAQLEARFQRSASHAEIADELGLSLPRYWQWCDEVGVEPKEAPAAGSGLPGEPGVTQFDGEQAILAAEEREEVRRVLATLPDRLQQVLALLYFEELTAREVAGLLGVTESRVSQLRKRALATMRTGLQARLRSA